jgi:predicted MFS family arabinose efflux permease
MPTAQAEALARMRSAAQPATVPGEWRSNWGIVLAATIGIAVSGSHYHVVGAMMKPLEAAYGWSRGEVAMALTIASFLAPFANIAVGALADRFGARRVALIGLPLFAGSFASLGLTGPALWTWYAGYVVIAIIGHAATAIVWTMAVVRHFTLNRGLALAISLSGTGILVSVIPAIVAGLVGHVGVSATFFTLGAAALLLAFPPAFLFLPRDYRRDGEGRAAVPPSAEQGGLTVREALGHSRFWRLAIAFLIVSSCVGMFIVHFQPVLTDSGMTPATAAKVALFLGPTMIAGRLVTGYLFDHFEPRAVAAIAFLLPGIACAMLLGLDGGFAFSAATAVMMGLGMGAEVDVLAYLTSRYFGLRRYGMLFGILIGLYGIGIGGGSALAGLFHDRTQSYDMTLLILGAAAFGAALLAATLGPPPGDRIAASVGGKGKA